MYIYIFTTSNMMTIADIIEVQQVKILQQTEVDIDPVSYTHLTLPTKA